MGTKQLRLDVAQLTDVGRRREHNEDNMAYVIPKDQQVMARKGALFIVADGMGGHAAGEVASEIAVDTVSNMYYQDDGDDVAVSLLHAIKRANALIHQRAAENMLRSGMGTTCVAAVLRGNMAYVANVGDSRAYLVRNGQVKQVSQDHSWVAEQVRAGLLTEEQARTHAQRNVITRCLGTQADVEIDVFPELLEEKDALVLCTDGLSGLVSDDEIRRIVGQSGPQESVYHLVERANENGGSDNITAIVVSVQEIGSEPPNARHPVYVGGRESDEDTALIGMVSNSPGSAASTVLSDGMGPSSSSLRYASGPLVSPESITAPQPVVQARPKRRRNRLFFPTLALLLVVVLAGLAGGGYYYLIRTNSGLADQHLQMARELMNNANKEVTANPAAALQDLATAQSTLRPLLNESLSTSQHNKLINLLQSTLPDLVKTAINNYNVQKNITPLPCPPKSSPALLNEGSTGAQAKTIVSLQGKNGTSLLYALDQNNKLYQVTPNNSLIPFPLPSPLNNAKVLDMASYGSELALLTASSSTDYKLALLSPDQKKLQVTSQINPDLLKNGQTPKLIAVSLLDVYVVIASDSTQQSSATILDYGPNKVHQPLSLAPTPSNLSVSAAIVSMAALPQHQLFFLLADGSIKSLAFAAGPQEATSVFVQQALAQPLALSASDFTWQKTVPVPTITPGGSEVVLALPGATFSRALVAAQVNTVQHLYVLDALSHRVLDLQVMGASHAPATSTQTPARSVTPTSTSTGGGVVTGTTLVNLARQYASPSLLAEAKSMTVDAQGSQVTVLTQTQQNTSSLSLVSFSTSSQAGCV